MPRYAITAASAAEATRVRSMKDRHLLFQGLLGAHTTPKTGRPWNRDSHKSVCVRFTVKRTQHERG